MNCVPFRNSSENRYRLQNSTLTRRAAPLHPNMTSRLTMAHSKTSSAGRVGAIAGKDRLVVLAITAGAGSHRTDKQRL